MSNNNVALVYSGVINDVIENVRKDFDEYGVDANVLNELKILWENKIKSAKVAPWETNGLPGEDHDQNNQNINGGSYMQQPMQPMQQPMQQMQQSMQQPPSDQNINYQQSRDPPAAASLPSRAVNINMHLNHNNEAGMPQPHINNGNGNPLPAQLSPSSSFPASSDISNISTPINSQVDVDQKIYHQQNYHPLIGQQQDDYGNSMGEKLIPRRETSNNSSPLPEFNTQIDPSFADNDDINSDLDDPEDEDTNADGEETQNIILCLYDKVTRTKNKWKCQLKDGIMSVNGRDYLFQKGNGDFEF